jgi:formylglycine-generating enzyme required for sulfatase activity
MTVRILLLVIVLTGINSSAAQAEIRRAFVVGINAYERIAKLEKAVNDAAAIARSLRDIGFKVTLIEERYAHRTGLLVAWHQFLGDIQPGDIVFVFFAGHGIQVRDRNYLLPRDIPFADGDEGVVLADAIAFFTLVEDLATRRPGASIFVLDACRNNPFRGPGGQRSLPNSAERGLAVIRDPRNAFILYSAGVNQQALDWLKDNSTELNSVFTTRLIQALNNKCWSMQRITKYVQNVVAKDARSNRYIDGQLVAHEQVPAYFDGIEGDFYLNCPVPEPVKPPAPVCRGLPIPVGAKAQSTCLTPGAGRAESFRDCETCPEMVVVPSGEFVMGSPDTEPGRAATEGPQRHVRLPKPFAVGKFEVTVREYEAFVAATGGVSDGGGCWVWTAYGHRFDKDRTFRNPSFAQTSTHPAVCVGWQAATTYANWLTTITRYKYRLLSEAEWEYAARAASTTRYYFGDSEALLCEHGNGADKTSAFLWGNHLCSDSVGVQTAEVGRYKANALGIYDVVGNVSEWVQDCVQPNYNGAPKDGSAWMAGNCTHRIIRGGAWDNDVISLRSAARGAADMKPKDTIGFRIGRELP